MEKQQILSKIKELVKKFNDLPEKDKNRFNEEQTKSYFIRPLFEALGWNFSDPSEVSFEENIVGKRADYEFKINNIPKIYIEAKSIKTDLDLEQHARQAINYAWNTGVNWAILTDFESIKVFNAQTQSKFLLDKIVFEIKAEDFESDFERLLLLSKESFLENGLDKYAEKHSKKVKKQTVNEKLSNDLRIIREELTKGFSNPVGGKPITGEILEEGIQRIIDRLVFIRVLEDRGLDEQILIPVLRVWEQNKNEQFFPKLKKKFRELDEVYNSSLFKKHDCEDWKEYSIEWKKIINLLHGTSLNEYDFSKIPTDILGGVYESYLSYISQNPIEIDIEGKSGKLFNIESKKEQKQKSRKKRKEQGIYYTPRFIVDYIVENTLGKKLAEAKNMADLKKIKILDPACGSGSFLTKALKTIYEKYEDFDSRADSQSIKTEILLNNIYGVDLDTQAVELAKLNLLIEALDKKAKLPDLTGNIRVGNSLISGAEAELKKYFGASWRDKQPFNWQDEFSEVFKNGGYDVVIGNPPYISARELDVKDKDFFEEIYHSAKDQYDIYTIFIEKSLNLLKEGGLLSFIIPNKFLITKYGLAIRKYIFENSEVINFKNYSEEKVFPEASVYPVVIVLRKTKRNANNKTDDYDLIKEFNLGEEDVVVKKMETIENKAELNVWRPIATSKNIIKGDKTIVTNREIKRYKADKTIKGNLDKKRDIDIIKNKIIIKKLCYILEAVLDEEGLYPINTTYCVLPKTEDIDIKYLLGVLNSKLLSYYVRKKYLDTALRGGFIELRVFQIEKIPVISTTKGKQNNIIKLVDLILDLNKQLQKTPENSDKWSAIKKEIEKTDKEIDEKVYELYGLTEGEIKIIEGK
jgi:SAM-dependent methyltransferase